MVWALLESGVSGSSVHQLADVGRLTSPWSSPRGETRMPAPARVVVAVEVKFTPRCASARRRRRRPLAPGAARCKMQSAGSWAEVPQRGVAKIPRDLGSRHVVRPRRRARRAGSLPRARLAAGGAASSAPPPAWIVLTEGVAKASARCRALSEAMVPLGDRAAAHPFAVDCPRAQARWRWPRAEATLSHFDEELPAGLRCASTSAGPALPRGRAVRRPAALEFSTRAGGPPPRASRAPVAEEQRFRAPPRASRPTASRWSATPSCALATSPDSDRPAAPSRRRRARGPLASERLGGTEGGRPAHPRRRSRQRFAPAAGW